MIPVTPDTITDTILRDVLLPRALLREPDRFGGTREGDCQRGDLQLSGGRAVALYTAPPTDAPRVVIPALVDAHCHLDKCHSLNRLGAVGGDLAAALDAQRRDKPNWTTEDLHRRMARGLSEFAQAGCMAVRSHIDWGEEPEPPRAWSVLRDLAADRTDMIVQQSALTGIAQIADETFCNKAARHIARHPGGALGAFVLDHEPRDIAAGLRNAFAAADRFGLPLDFHVDEGLGTFNGLERICDMAMDTRFDGPVLCGHAVSLIDRSGADLQRILDKLLAARITICALPTTNLYLQGRRDGTPDRRGLTRLRELQAAGVPIAVASDNVADAFCPLGQHDPRAALHLAALTGHLDPPMGQWLAAITLNPARAMGLAAPFIEDTPMQALRLGATRGTADLIAGRCKLTPLHPEQEALTQ